MIVNTTLVKLAVAVILFYFVSFQNLFAQNNSEEVYKSVINSSKDEVYIPVKLLGFTHDVIANGVGSAMNSTNASVDFSPGNSFSFVAEDFRFNQNSTPPTCFLPNSRQIINGNKRFTLANYSQNNSLRLMGPNQYGTLWFETPIAAEKLYLLGLSGSGHASFDVQVWFADGTSQTFYELFFPDWFSYMGNIVLSNVGRVNRNQNILECGGGGPQLFEIELSIPLQQINIPITKIVILTQNLSEGVFNALAVSVKPSEINNCSDISSSLIINSTNNQVCLGEPFNLYVETDIVPQNGITYKWQQTPSGENNWADIDGAIMPFITVNTGITSNTDFRCIVTCELNSSSTISNSKTISLKQPNECYCIPIGPTNNSDEIVMFSLSNINNNSNPGSSGYVDYSNLLEPIVLYYGSMYKPIIKTGLGTGNHGAAIWIDYNDDGVFEESEKVVWIDNILKGDKTYFLPSMYVLNYPGIHRLRLQYESNNSGEFFNPCYVSTSYSEVEDYLVNIILPDCYSPNNFEVTSVTDNSAILSWQNTSADNIEIYLSEEIMSPLQNTSPSYILSGASSSIEINNLEANHIYYAWIRAKCSENEYSAWSGPIEINLAYCGVIFPYSYLGITEFTTTNAYSNISNQSEVNSYSDFSNFVCTQFKGNTVYFTIKSSYYDFASKIWIDWNNNLQFDDNEVVYSSICSGEMCSGSFVVPNDVEIGKYRMRIVSVIYFATPVPCGDLGYYYYAEAEDYSLMVIDASSCLPPINFDVDNITDVSATFNWEASLSSDIMEYGIYVSTSSSNPSQTANSTYDIPDYETSFQVNNLEPNTQYYAWIRTNCSSSGNSMWVGPINFITNLCNPSNQCNFTFELMDSFGDGWDNNNIDVVQNGIITHNLKLESGSFEAFILPICNEGVVEIKLNLGSWFHEISFRIISPWGDTIAYFNGFDFNLSQNGVSIFSWVAECEDVNCEKPSSAHITYISTNSVGVLWDDFSGANEWEIAYSKLGSNPFLNGVFLQGVMQNSINISSLQPATSYQLFIRSVCDTDNKSSWFGPVLFTTLQLPEDLPFVENFDSTVCKWNFVNSEFNVWKHGTSMSNSGNYSIFISAYGFDECLYTNDYPAVSHFYRDITIPSTDNWIKLEFNWRGLGNPDDRIQVHILPTNVFPVVDEELSQGQIGLSKYHFHKSWSKAEIELDPAIYSGQTIRLVFSWLNEESYLYGNYSDDPVAIDDISMYLISCPKPKNLLYNNIEENIAEISWEEVGNSTLWDLAVGDIGFNPDTEGSLIESISQSNYLLNYNGVKQVYVRSKCGVNEHSSWFGPINIGNYCVPSTINQECYISSFSTDGANQNIINNGSGVSVIGYSDFTNLVLDQNAGQNVSFSAYIAGHYSGFRIMIDFNQNGVFSQNEIVYQSSEQLNYHNSSFVIPSNVPSGTTRMRIICNPFEPNGYVNPCVSNFYQGEFEDYTVEIYNNSACNPPLYINSLAVSSTSAWLMWSNSPPNPFPILPFQNFSSKANDEITPIGYQIYYSNSSVPPTASTIPCINIGAVSFYQLTNLIPNTEYFVWIRSKCGNNFFSEWSNPMSFSTNSFSNTDFIEFGFGAFDYQTADINYSTKTINAYVIYGTDLSNLIAFFTLSDGAIASVNGVIQESGVTPNNFSNNCTETYVVIASDGSNATWTVNVQAPVGINNTNAIGVKIFPNPNNGNFALLINNINGDCRYELVDITGRCLISKQIEVSYEYMEYINHSLKSGTYLLRVISEKDIACFRFVVKE